MSNGEKFVAAIFTIAFICLVYAIINFTKIEIHAVASQSI